jgi:regulator of protease activity HflC (stomatin/prohibitin superfamily)
MEEDKENPTALQVKKRPGGRIVRPPAFGRPPGWVLIPVVLAAIALWVWFFCRIEPDTDEIAVLIRKTGEDLPSGRIIAEGPHQKGVQMEVLPEGRYFRNPYTWGWTIHPITDIPAGKLGVLIRLYGEDPPPGAVIADSKSKGIVGDVLRPGKYRINPYAYMVQLFDAVSVRPGHVGIVTSLIGRDVTTEGLPADKRNRYLVEKGFKGVVADVLDPGTYYLNPYMYSVVEMTLQSQRFEMSGEDAINFLTMDGFTVTVEGTIEYSIEREHAALLTHKVGDMEDILKKIILPRARGFSRIEGSKNPAIAYIVGETRQQFQNSLEQHLKERCLAWGVNIRSVLIRNISPPDEIARIIRDREVAVQTAKMFERQIEQAKSKAELTRQEMLARQNKEKVEAETGKIKAVIKAGQEQEVRITAALKELEVAKLENDAATFQAQSKLLAAGAEAEVIRSQNEAQAQVLKEQASALGGGMGLARYTLYTNLAPRITSILTTDRSDALGGVFEAFRQQGSRAADSHGAAPVRQGGRP